MQFKLNSFVYRSFDIPLKIWIKYKDLHKYFRPSYQKSFKVSSCILFIFLLPLSFIYYISCCTVCSGWSQFLFYFRPFLSLSLSLSYSLSLYPILYIFILLSFPLSESQSHFLPLYPILSPSILFSLPLYPILSLSIPISPPSILFSLPLSYSLPL